MNQQRVTDVWNTLSCDSIICSGVDIAAEKKRLLMNKVANGIGPNSNCSCGRFANNRTPT